MRYISDILGWPQESCISAAATYYLAASLHVRLGNRKAAVYHAVQSLKFIERHLGGADGQPDFIDSLELRLFAPSIPGCSGQPSPAEFRRHVLFMASSLLSADSFFDEALQLTVDGMESCSDPVIVEAFDGLAKTCIQKLKSLNKRLAKARLQAYKQRVDERSLEDGMHYRDFAFYQDRDGSCPQRIAIGGTNPKFLDLDPVRHEISFMHNPLR